MNNAQGGIERRLPLRLMAYWEKLRDGRPMPAEDDIDPEDLLELWDHCFLVHISEKTDAPFNYSYLGSAIVEAYRGKLAESDRDSLVGLDASKLSSSYRKVISSCSPVVEEGEFNNLLGDTVKYRQCMLPLGHDGQVRAIFGGMRFKVFPVAH